MDEYDSNMLKRAIYRYYMGGRWKIGTENIQPKKEERKCVIEGRFCLDLIES
jgi:hypothetical protein